MNWNVERYESFGEGIHREVAVDDLDYPQGGLWDAYNIVYNLESDSPEKMRGYAQIGSTLPGTTPPIVTGMFDFREGTKLLVTASDGKMYHRTTGDFSAVTDATGLNTTATTRWDGVMSYGSSSAADILILSNGIDAPKKYDGTSLSALSDAPALGRFPVIWMNRAWLFVDDLAYYTAADNCEGWAAEGSGTLPIFRGYGGAITGVVPFANCLVIFKRDKIFRITPGATINGITVGVVADNTGCINHRTIKEAGPEGASYLVFLSESGFEAIFPTGSTGGFVVRPVGTPVGDIINARDKTKDGTAWSLYNPARKEYYCFFVQGTGNTYPTGQLIANSARYKKPLRWTFSALPSMTAGCMYNTTSGELQYVGNSAGKVFRMHYGDDWLGLDYRGFLYTRAYHAGRPSAMKRYNRAYVNIQSEGESVDARLYLGRHDLPVVPGNINRSFVGKLATGGWGSAYSEAAWGGTAVTTGKWIRPYSCTRGNYMRVQVDSIYKDRWFRLCGLEIESAWDGSSMRG